MQITEPVTMLTDFALAAASLYFAFHLARILCPRNRVSAWLWSAAFLASAVAALLGGIYHGFALHFEASTLRSMWNVAVFVMGLSSGCMVGGIHAAYVRRDDGTVTWDCIRRAGHSDWTYRSTDRIQTPLGIQSQRHLPPYPDRGVLYAFQRRVYFT